MAAAYYRFCMKEHAGSLHIKAVKNMTAGGAGDMRTSATLTEDPGNFYVDGNFHLYGDLFFHGTNTEAISVETKEYLYSDPYFVINTALNATTGYIGSTVSGATDEVVLGAKILGNKTARLTYTDLGWDGVSAIYNGFWKCGIDTSMKRIARIEDSLQTDVSSNAKNILHDSDLEGRLMFWDKDTGMFKKTSLYWDDVAKSLSFQYYTITTSSGSISAITVEKEVVFDLNKSGSDYAFNITSSGVPIAIDFGTLADLDYFNLTGLINIGYDTTPGSTVLTFPNSLYITNVAAGDTKNIEIATAGNITLNAGGTITLTADLINQGAPTLVDSILTKNDTGATTVITDDPDFTISNPHQGYIIDVNDAATPLSIAFDCSKTQITTYSFTFTATWTAPKLASVIGGVNYKIYFPYKPTAAITTHLPKSVKGMIKHGNTWDPINEANLQIVEGGANLSLGAGTLMAGAIDLADSVTSKYVVLTINGMIAATEYKAVITVELAMWSGL